MEDNRPEQTYDEQFSLDRQREEREDDSRAHEE